MPSNVSVPVSGGRIVDADGVLANTAPGAYTTLGQGYADEPTPWVFSIQTRDTGLLASIPATEVGQTITYIVSPIGSGYGVANDWSEEDNQGNLLIEYGTGGNQNFRIIDIRDGSYQLPPCTAVTVRGRVYNRSPYNNADAVDIAGSLAPGVVPGGGAVATYTGYRFLPAGADGASFVQVAGVKAYRYGLVNTTPRDVLIDIRGALPHVAVDYNTPTYSPNVFDLAPSGDETPVMSKTGTGTADFYMQAVVGF